MNPHEEISRGERARQILQDQMFQEAITAIKGENYKDYLASTDSNERDEIWRQAQAIQKLEQRLESVMQSGIMARQTLDNGANP